MRVSMDFRKSFLIAWTMLAALSAAACESDDGVVPWENTRVAVESDPEGAVIEVDGTNSGRKTPFTLELPAGEYQLTLFVRGYQAVNKRVVVQANRTSAINEVLPK